MRMDWPDINIAGHCSMSRVLEQCSLDKLGEHDKARRLPVARTHGTCQSCAEEESLPSSTRRRVHQYISASIISIM